MRAGVRPGLRAGGRVRGGGGVGADGACVRETGGGGEGGRDHRVPPLGAARCLAMSEPAPAPTSSVWVSGSCPEGLCRSPGQPTYLPGPGAGQCPMGAASSHCVAATAPGGGPSAHSCQWLRRGRGRAFHVWLTALCLFFFPPLPLESNVKERERGRGREGSGEREARERVRERNYVKDAALCLSGAAATWAKGLCFSSPCFTPKLLSRQARRERLQLRAGVKTIPRLLTSHFLSVPSWEPVV